MQKKTMNMLDGEDIAIVPILRAGLGMVDGIVLMGTGHALGDRAYIIAKYGQRYIAEKGEHVKLVEKDDFERRSVINYPVTGGSYIIDYSNGVPRVRFQSN